jgi:hypothetical protein
LTENIPHTQLRQTILVSLTRHEHGARALLGIL